MKCTENCIYFAVLLARVYRICRPCIRVQFQTDRLKGGSATSSSVLSPKPTTRSFMTYFCTRFVSSCDSLTESVDSRFNCPFVVTRRLSDARSPCLRCLRLRTLSARVRFACGALDMSSGGLSMTSPAAGRRQTAGWVSCLDSAPCRHSRPSLTVPFCSLSPDRGRIETVGGR